MKFGLFTSAQANSGDLGPETGQGFRDYLDFNVAAERLGFVSSFSVEHHFTGWNQVSATLMLLTALAMRTTRLRLGSAVMVLPWHNPVLLAEQAATLDLISGGRLDLGIGKGYRHSEFKGFQIAPEEAEARFDEALEVMVRAFTERDRFSHRGRFWRFEDIVVEPPPAQKPHPPLWVAAGSAASIRRAAARGFNLILDQYAAPELIAERIALFKAERKAHGLSFDPMQVAVARQLYVAEDEADRVAALERQAAYTRRTVEVSRPPADPPASRVRTCSLMPIKQAVPRNMLCLARRISFTRSSNSCGKPARFMCCSQSRVGWRSCSVSRARSCPHSPALPLRRRRPNECSR